MDDPTPSEQAARWATRVPLPFDRTAHEILRSNGVLGRLARKRDAAGHLLWSTVETETAFPDRDQAAAQLEVLVLEAERGRAWHPEMGTSWDTAEQAAPR